MHNNLYEIVESSAAENIVAFEDVRTSVYIYLIITRQLFCKITCMLTFHAFNNFPESVAKRTFAYGSIV